MHPSRRARASASLSRRSFVGCSLGAAAPLLLHGGGFAAGAERIRVGLVGCGGRGTGAAIHAAAADPAVRITALADLFGDHVDASAAILSRAAGAAFDCPVERRFFGADAWRRVIESDVDIVILATSPDARPRQAAAAVAAGKHLFCETPGAVDWDGLRQLSAACAEARDRGLSFVSGLAWRRHPATVEAVARIHAGLVGRPLSVRVTSRVGLPWQRPVRPGWTAEESRLRNWITWADLSGGDFVERHIHALDKALWVCGDDDPIAAEPLDHAGSPAGATAVRFRFADGRTVEAVSERRAGAADAIEERVVGTAGTCDLRRPVTAGPLDRPHAAATPDRARPGMEVLVRAVRVGGRIDDGGILCRSTGVALLGRAAAARGETVAWTGDRRPVEPA